MGNGGVCPLVGHCVPLLLLWFSGETVAVAKARVWQESASLHAPRKFELWKDLKPIGDDWWEGTLLKETDTVGSFAKWGDVIEAEQRNGSGTKQRMTRLEIVKQLFNAFVNRSQAYNYPTRIGLILFGSTVNEVCKVTPLFEKFRDHIDSVNARGDTRMYDAIQKAADSLVAFRTDHAGCALRIICFSDGKDTKSTAMPLQVVSALQRNSIILDGIRIADGASDTMLHTMCKATGGYSFNPTNLKDALRLMELETLLFLAERPQIAPVRRAVGRLNELTKFTAMPVDVCNETTVPARRLPAELSQASLSLELTLERGAPPVLSKRPDEASRIRRIMQELRLLMSEPHPSVEVFPCESNIRFWRLLLKGPEESPYAGGVWLLYANFSEEYPLRAPEMRFVTPIKHSNVNHYGKICHSIFTRNWTSDTTMRAVSDLVYALMLHPETQDPLDTTLAMQYFEDPGVYEVSIAEHVARHATGKTMEQVGVNGTCSCPQYAGNGTLLTGLDANSYVKSLVSRGVCVSR
eukprot:TRINITY_DN851_c0_g1_i5.p2 TRINITY_DN851_c0_g1~~TRINITY_DN851_c0_g1_i5.p2  ORF type:complete len:522 (-),score=161.57 TRINITY_DN851_c0_g1_i5:965-2530(-)